MTARLLGGILLITFSAATAADRVVRDDLVAPSLCIGGECAAGDAADAEVRQQEEIMRLRLIDSTATNTAADGRLGASWSLIANDYGAASDARSYFGFTLRSIDPTPNDGGNNIVARHLLRLGPASGNATAIGGDSALVDGAVSLGNAYVKRRLVNVASAIEATDLLIKRQLDDGLLGSVAQLNAQLDAIEAEIAALESEIDSESATGREDSGGGGRLSSSLLALLAALVVLYGRQSLMRNRPGITRPFA